MRLLCCICLFCCYSIPFAQAICVGSQYTELYLGPGTSYPKSAWKFKAFTPLKQIDVYNEWIRVEDVEKDTHWIHQGAIVVGMKCVIMIQNTMRREGPAEDFDEKGSAHRHETYRLAAKEGEWLQVVDQHNADYWIQAKFVWQQ